MSWTADSSLTMDSTTLTADGAGGQSAAPSTPSGCPRMPFLYRSPNHLKNRLTRDEMVERLKL